MNGKKWLAIAILSTELAVAAVGCSKKSDAPAAPAGKGGKGGKGGAGLEFPVETAPITLRQIGYVISAPGSINAFEQVQVTARVAGAVDRVSFTEGQTVTAGQALASIESERYQVAVDQAKAAVSKAQAAESNAESQLARRQGATADHPGLITGEEIATYQTQVQTAKADVMTAQEALKVASLNLRDSYVRAPIAGVIQTRTVETGQYLQPGVVLATLLQRDPLLLKFQVTEQDAPRLHVGDVANIALRESAHTYQAKITLVAGSADPQSHLVPVSAEVDDKEHKYWLRPGVFCDVSIPVGGTRPAAVIPEGAIRATENGFVAFTVDGTTAHQKVLTLGMHSPGGLVEVTNGLSEGDQLVLLGGDPLVEGSTVKVTDKTTLEAFDAGAAPATSASAVASSNNSHGGAPMAMTSGSPASISSTTAATVATTQAPSQMAPVAATMKTAAPPPGPTPPSGSGAALQRGAP